MKKADEILGYITAHGLGRKNTISAKTLVEKFGVHERQLRRIIQHLRVTCNQPIASTYAKPSGYYIPNAQKDVDACMAQHTSAARSLSILGRRMQASFNKINKSVKQLPLL